MFEQEGKNISFDDDTAAYLKNFQVDVMYKDNPHKKSNKEETVQFPQLEEPVWKLQFCHITSITARCIHASYGNKPIKDIVSLGVESIEDINLSKLWNFENLGEDKNIWFAKEEIRYAHEYNWLNAFESNPSKVNKLMISMWM